MRPSSTKYSSNVAHEEARRTVSRRTGSVPAAMERQARMSSATVGAAAGRGRNLASSAAPGAAGARRAGAKKSVRSRAAAAAADAKFYGGRAISKTASGTVSAAEAVAAGTGRLAASGLSTAGSDPGSRLGGTVPAATPSAQLGASAKLAKKIASVPVSPVMGSASKTLRRAQAVELDILMKRHPGSIKKDPELVRMAKSHRKKVLRRKRKAQLKHATLGQKAGRAIGGRISRKVFKGRAGRKRFLRLRSGKNKFALATSALSLGGVVLMGSILASSIGLMQYSHQSSGSTSGGGNADAYMEQARKYCEDDSIGYSRDTRCHNPNMDCSSFVYYCLVDSGYCTTDELGSGPFNTQSEEKLLVGSGKFETVANGVGTIKMDSLQPGDILLRDVDQKTGHTEIYMGDGKSCAAHDDYDGKNGDGNGKEVCYGPYDNYTVWNKVLRPVGGAGGSISIPKEYGKGGYTVCFYTKLGILKDGRDMKWDAGTGQSAVHEKWAAAGYVYTDDIATIGGRYLIACTSTYGKCGDKVDFYLEDGTVIHCIVADAKSPTDAGCNKWGHSNGQNVLEFEVNRSRYSQCGNPGSSSWKSEWGGKRVCSATNLGSIL